MKDSQNRPQQGFFREDGYLSRENILILLLLLLNLFLILSQITPQFGSVSGSDGDKYVESGRLLLKSGLRDLAWGPLVAFIYAPIHWLVGRSPNWFMIEAWVGNAVLFVLIWLSFLALADTLKNFIAKPVFIAILFLSTFYAPVIENKSDALFVALSALALASLIRFHQAGHLKSIWLASLFVSLGFFTRVESILLMVPLVIFSLILNKKRQPWFKILLANLLPVAALFVLFVLVNFMTYGSLDTGLGYKSLDSFEMNHAFLPGSPNEQAYQRGEDIFGPPEELQGSVLRAILNNPLAILERAAANLLKLPAAYLDFFGKAHGPVILLFAIWGVVSLFKAGGGTEAWLLLIWPLHALISLIFFPRHIIPQMSYFFLIACAVGVSHFLRKGQEMQKRLILGGISFVGLMISWVLAKPAFMFGALILLFVAMLDFVIKTDILSPEGLRIIPAILLLVGGLVLRPSYAFPMNRIGVSEDELAVHFLLTLSPDEDVETLLVSYPTPALASRLFPVYPPLDVENSDDVLAFLQERGVDLVFLDLKKPYQTEWIERTVADNPDAFELIYQSESGNIRIFIPHLEQAK